MKIWLITDTHFGHRAMEEYCGRPKDFEARIFKNLKQIQPDDVVIHLGDFCIGDDVKWHDAWNSALFSNKRIIIRGNHDRKSDSWYYAHGWHAVCDNLSGHYFNRYITFSHIPIPDIQNLNIHGHFHNNLHRLLEGKYVVDGEKERNEPILSKLTSNHKLLVLEHDYRPVTLESFITPLTSTTMTKEHEHTLNRLIQAAKNLPSEGIIEVDCKPEDIRVCARVRNYNKSEKI